MEKHSLPWLYWFDWISRSNLFKLSSTFRAPTYRFLHQAIPQPSQLSTETIEGQYPTTFFVSNLESL